MVDHGAVSLPLAERLASIKMPVTAAEVLGWFRKHQRPWPSEAQCAPIADRLNVITAGGWGKAEYEAAIDGKIAERYAAAGIPVLELQSGSREWWDFARTAEAARDLLAAIPAMREHWGRLEWAPETAGGTAAIDALAAVLAAAMPRIDHPFGEYDRATGQKAPKPWHIPAVNVLPTILWAMHNAGQKRLGRSGNSIAVSILRRGLIRAGVRDMDMATPEAMGAFLSRYPIWRGATVKEIVAMAGAPHPGKGAVAAAG